MRVDAKHISEIHGILRKTEQLIHEKTLLKVRLIADFYQYAQVKNSDINYWSMELEYIKDLVRQYYSISKDDWNSKTHKEYIVNARNMCVLLLSEYTQLGVTNIARVMDRNHSSVIKGIKTMNSYMSIYSEYTSSYLFLKQQIENHFKPVTHEDKGRTERTDKGTSTCPAIP